MKRMKRLLGKTALTAALVAAAGGTAAVQSGSPAPASAAQIQAVQADGVRTDGGMQKLPGVRSELTQNAVLKKSNRRYRARFHRHRGGSGAWILVKVKGRGGVHVFK